MRVCIAYYLTVLSLIPICSFAQSNCIEAFQSHQMEESSFSLEQALLTNKKLNQLTSRLSQSELHSILTRVIYKLSRGDSITIENLDAHSAQVTIQFLVATQYISFDGVPGEISLVKYKLTETKPYTRGRNVQINSDGTFTLIDANQNAIQMFHLTIIKAF